MDGLLEFVIQGGNENRNVDEEHVKVMDLYDKWYVESFGRISRPNMEILAKHLNLYLDSDKDVQGDPSIFARLTVEYCLGTALDLAKPLCKKDIDYFSSLYAARMVIVISAMYSYGVNYNDLTDVLTSDAYKNCSYGQTYIRLIKTIMTYPHVWRKLKDTVFAMTNRMYDFLELPKLSAPLSKRNLPAVLNICAKRYAEIELTYKPPGY